MFFHKETHILRYDRICRKKLCISKKICWSNEVVIQFWLWNWKSGSMPNLVHCQVSFLFLNFLFLCVWRHWGVNSFKSMPWFMSILEIFDAEKTKEEEFKILIFYLSLVFLPHTHTHTLSFFQTHTHALNMTLMSAYFLCLLHISSDKMQITLLKLYWEKKLNHLNLILTF